MNHYKPSDSEQFVRRVMTALPERESVPQRVGRILLRFIASPLWIWLCMVTLVVVARRPILAVLSVAADMSLSGLLVGALGLTAAVAFFSLQMIRSVRL